MSTRPSSILRTDLRLLDLHARLDDDDDVVATARPVNPELADPHDPRIVDVSTVDAFNRVMRLGQPLVLVEWPDMTLAWVWLPFGQSIHGALLDGYRDGRARLELIHLRHDEPAGSA